MYEKGSAIDQLPSGPLDGERLDEDLAIERAGMADIDKIERVYRYGGNNRSENC